MAGAVPERRRRLGAFLLGLLGTAAAVYGGGVALLWRFQERFIFPVRHGREAVTPEGRWQVGEVAVPGSGALRFRFAEGAGSGDLPVVLYFHGNASSTVSASGYTNFLPEAGFPTVLATYPGYSGNPGAPGEAALRVAAEAVEGWARARWPGRRIAAWGESIGGFPASHLASEGRADLLVLDSAFTSLAEAAGHHFPWVPGLRALLRHPMENLSRLGAMPRPVPVLVLVTSGDPVVPTRMGEEIAARVGATLHRSPVRAHPAVVWDDAAAGAAVRWLKGEQP